jgi:hypothetical protein
MKISIILPLFDRRDVGWAALESALEQQLAGTNIEVVVVATADLDGGRDDAKLEKLLERCDVVVRIESDSSRVADEIHFYQAGGEQATGDLLFFAEGHTVLQRQCCATIADFFEQHPEVELAWAPRINHGKTRLGRLLTLHNLRHEQRATKCGVFSLGANSIIRREGYDRLGGLDPRHLRFAETALWHRALGNGLRVGHITVPLATHHNDMPIAYWRELVSTAGEARFSYYAALESEGADLRTQARHPVYMVARHPTVARFLNPISRLAGRGLLLLAMATLPLNQPFAYRLYVFALGFTDLGGYCNAALHTN